MLQTANETCYALLQGIVYKLKSGVNQLPFLSRDKPSFCINSIETLLQNKKIELLKVYDLFNNIETVYQILNENAQINIDPTIPCDVSSAKRHIIDLLCVQIDKNNFNTYNNILNLLINNFPDCKQQFQLRFITDLYQSKKIENHKNMLEQKVRDINENKQLVNQTLQTREQNLQKIKTLQESLDKILNEIKVLEKSKKNAITITKSHLEKRYPECRLNQGYNSCTGMCQEPYYSEKIDEVIPDEKKIKKINEEIEQKTLKLSKNKSQIQELESTNMKLEKNEIEGKNLTFWGSNEGSSIITNATNNCNIYRQDIKFLDNMILLFQNEEFALHRITANVNSSVELMEIVTPRNYTNIFSCLGISPINRVELVFKQDSVENSNGPELHAYNN